MLQDLVLDTNTTVGRHPSDFRLYCVGTFDDQNGRIITTDPLLFVCDAIALVTQEEKSNG